MTEKTEIPIPTQEIAQAYLKRINEDVVIELRVKAIANKIDKLFKKTYRVEDEVPFNYTCYFMDKKLVYKLLGTNGVSILLPSLPESCLWDDTDLHINMNLMESDIIDNYTKTKKLKDSLTEEPPTFWERIKSWF